MMKRSSKMPTIFDAIFNTFLICVKVIILLRINDTFLAIVYFKFLLTINYTNYNLYFIKKINE